MADVVGVGGAVRFLTSSRAAAAIVFPVGCDCYSWSMESVARRFLNRLSSSRTSPETTMVADELDATDVTDEGNGVLGCLKWTARNRRVAARFVESNLVGRLSRMRQRGSKMNEYGRCPPEMKTPASTAVAVATYTCAVRYQRWLRCTSYASGWTLHGSLPSTTRWCATDGMDESLTPLDDQSLSIMLLEMNLKTMVLSQMMRVALTDGERLLSSLT
jgi:hypothetical protein